MDSNVPPVQMPVAKSDRKVLRETLYSEILQRHRRSIFALGSFLRMLKSKKSNYNVIKQDGESE